jgi:hypothetical protein
MNQFYAFVLSSEVIALVAGTLPFAPAIYQVFNGFNVSNNNSTIMYFSLGYYRND